jgi:hypothetical protein
MSFPLYVAQFALWIGAVVALVTGLAGILGLGRRRR